MAPKTAKKPAKKVARKTVKKIAKKTARKTARKAKKVVKKKARKAKRVSVIAKGRMAKSQVLKGRKARTVGGLKASDLTKNKAGKVVSKKASAKGKKSPWIAACAKARSALNIKGFAIIGGKTAQGKALHAKAKAFYKK